MKDRPAYNVEKPMLLYNIVQIVINTHFFFMVIGDYVIINYGDLFLLGSKY